MSEYTISATGEKVPLSFTGRHLLQKLREAIHEALKASDYSVHDNELSRVRGELAKYLSRREQEDRFRKEFLTDRLGERLADREAQLHTVKQILTWIVTDARYKPPEMASEVLPGYIIRLKTALKVIDGQT